MTKDQELELYKQIETLEAKLQIAIDAMTEIYEYDGSGYNERTLKEIYNGALNEITKDKPHE